MPAQTFHSLLTTVSPSARSGAAAITIPGSGSAPAIHLDYNKLADYVQAFAEALEGVQIQGGQVVSLSLINSLEFVGAFLATGWLRAVSAPLNPAYSQDEIEFYLTDTKSSILVVLEGETSQDKSTIKAAKKCGVKVVSVKLSHGQDGKVEVILKDVYTPSAGSTQGTKQGGLGIANADQQKGGSVKEQDVALVLHTSGTTGKPKGVPLTHLNIMTTMANIVKTYEFTPEDRGLLVMPLFHVHGLVAGLLAPLLAGASIVIPTKFSAGSFWKDFTSEKCNWYTAVPTIHSILLSSPLPNPLPKIRFIRSCSSSLSPTVFHRLEETFKAPVLEAYAMSEAAHQMCASPLPKNGPRYPGSVGVPQGVGLSIRNADNGKEVTTKGEKGRGEVCIRGRNVMLGYVNNEKANREGYWDAEDAQGAKEKRWFRTGDEGYLTDEGYLVLTGRLKELINRGGEKISPIELDSAILALPGVSEAVSFGVADEKYGEKVWAAVILKDAGGKDERQVEKDLKQALAGKVAKFKIPERIIITQAIPKTATGKIQRRHVRDQFVKQEAEKAKSARQSKL